ncbi:bifunctional glutamate N-acetyltransferase/amino-acid acetyltransferase ArgJ [Chloroflexota bacterium]
MKVDIIEIPSGTVTSPKGFQAGAINSGMKENSIDPDLGILRSERSCVAAGVFTSNKIKAAPVLLSRERLSSGRAVAVVVNSEVANCCTGAQGFKDAEETTVLTAEKLGVPLDEVLVASTGVIGEMLPMEHIRRGISQLTLSSDGGHALARAMMTTDTVPKEAAVSAGSGKFIIGGVSKGSGMIHPNMGTMLSFLTTDAAVNLDFLKDALQKAVDISFNMISVDGDTSTNDTVIVMANGLAGNETITQDSKNAPLFQEVLNSVCIFLAKEMARDGEGAGKLIEVNVTGSPDIDEAKQAARTIAASTLVKTAVYGNDPNWGRVLAAIGRSGVRLIESKIDLYLGDICVFRQGEVVAFNRRDGINLMKNDEVSININLNLGMDVATAWGCDMTPEYVIINSEYTT